MTVHHSTWFPVSVCHLLCVNPRYLLLTALVFRCEPIPHIYQAVQAQVEALNTLVASSPQSTWPSFWDTVLARVAKDCPRYGLPARFHMFTSVSTFNTTPRDIDTTPRDLNDLCLPSISCFRLFWEFGSGHFRPSIVPCATRNPRRASWANLGKFVANIVSLSLSRNVHLP